MSDATTPSSTPLDAADRLTLVEAVDRVLHKGAVIAGDVTISVADISLVRLELQVVLGATESLLEAATAGKTEETR